LFNLSPNVPLAVMVAVGGGDQLGKLRAEDMRHRALFWGDYRYATATVEQRRRRFEPDEAAAYDNDVPCRLRCGYDTSTVLE
jgi:hypothetical protein